MSDLGLDADLTLDIRSALEAADRLRIALDRATSGQTIQVNVDTVGIPDEITTAIDSADSQVVVTGEAADLTGDVTAAIDAADTAVSIEGDASDVTASVDDAVDQASPATVPVEGDADPLKESIRDGLGEGPRQAPAAGSQTGGAFASAFSRSVTAAVRALPEVTIGADSSEAQREIASLRDQLVRLNDQTIGVDISADEAVTELGRIQDRLDVLQAARVSPTVDVDVAAASAALSQVTTQLDRVDSSAAGVGVGASQAADGVGDLSDALGDVNLGLVAAAGSGVRLRAIFQALSVTGVAVGLFQAAQAASDLGESTSKATVVFGDGIETVQAFARESATAVGLSESAALEATATFGNLFVALGATKEQATDLSPEVVGLAADLASFNNLGVDETLEKLRSGLVGEIEPLRSLGISFDAAAVEAKAMELGLVDANGAVSEGAKLQARWALILEQSTTAQGDFARTSDGLANQQRILTAEFQNAVIALGQALLPALLEGVAVARSDLIPAFQQIGEELLPALARAFVSLLPVAGSFAQILVSLSPVIVTVANAIASLPPELITLIGLMVAFRRVAGSDFLSGLVGKFKELANPQVGPGGFATSLKSSVGSMIAANAASVGLGLAIGAIGLAFQEEAEKAAKFQRELQAVKTALDTALEPGVETIDAFADVFTQLVEQGGTGASVLAEMGITAEEFSQSVAKGGDLLENLAQQTGRTKEELGPLNLLLDDFVKQVDQAAKAQVEAIRASGDLSEGFIDNAIAAETQTTKLFDTEVATTDYVAVLGTLTAEQNRAAEAIGVTVDETGQLVTAVGPAADAANVLALGLEQVTSRGGDANLELTNLAIAAGNARVAEEDLQTVADQLGVSLEDLETFVSSVNDAINTFADTTLGTLPSVGDIIGDLGEDFSPQALLDKLREATEGIANFSTNLEDLAAFPRVQQIAAENGPLVAAALAQPVQDGNTEVVQALEDQLGAFDLHYAGLDDQLRNELGPQIADATGLTGTLATEAFGENFNPAAGATVAVHGTIASIEQENANMTNAGAGLGQSGTDGFGTGISGMPTKGAGEADRTVEEIAARQFAANLAGALFGGQATTGFSGGIGAMPGFSRSAADTSIDAIENRGPFAKIAGTTFGGGFSSGTGTGAAGMSSAAAGAANSAIGTVQSKTGGARGAGFSLGQALAQGMQSGINSLVAAVGAAAAALVQGAIDRANSTAQTGSPSKVFIRLGEDMGTGVAVGLADTTEAVASQAASLVDTAAAAASGTIDVAARALNVANSLPSSALAVSTSNGHSPGDMTVNVLPGAIVIQTPSDTPGAIAAAREAARRFPSELTVATRRINTGARIGG